MGTERKGEGETDRQRQRLTDRQKERKKDRQKHRQTERHRQTETERFPQFCVFPVTSKIRPVRSRKTTFILFCSYGIPEPIPNAVQAVPRSHSFFVCSLNIVIETVPRLI